MTFSPRVKFRITKLMLAGEIQMGDIKNETNLRVYNTLKNVNRTAYKNFTSLPVSIPHALEQCSFVCRHAVRCWSDGLSDIGGDQRSNRKLIACYNKKLLTSSTRP